ncbi:MAG: hypothetical protein GBAus27B_000562 [Mycoplasmataceae bacterium]|nr:MAG: hypothetical protein GBAus27B_000562 [Mycoplasmataceae bacterium]
MFDKVLIPTWHKEEINFEKCNIKVIMTFWELLTPELQAQLNRIVNPQQLENISDNKHPWTWIIGTGIIFILIT